MSATATVERYSIEAEISVLGACLLEVKAARAATGMLTVSDFYEDAHKEIFGAIQSLVASGDAVDLTTVYAELRRRGVRAAIGSVRLVDLVEKTPTAANVVHYARIVKDYADRRRLRDLCTQTAEKVNREDADLARLVADLRDRLDALHTGGESKRADAPPWPKLPDDALYGLAGEMVQAVKPWSEADPVGILVHLLVAFTTVRLKIKQ